MQQLHQPSHETTASGAALLSTRGSEAQALLTTLQRLAHSAAALLNVATVSIALLDSDTGRLVNWVALGADGAFTHPPRPLPREDIEGWVVMRQTPILVDDIYADTRFDGEQRFRSLICAPLLEASRILGTLTVTSPQPHTFDAQHQRVVQVFCDQATLAIGKTLQAEASATQTRELGALLDASRALTSSLDPAQVFAYITASIRKVIACDDAVIYVYDERAEQLHVVAGMGSRIERLEGASISLNDQHSVAAWVALHRRARLSSPGYGEVGSVTETFLSGDELSLLCVPLISKDALRGVIMLARLKPFRPTELSAMLNLSNIVAATLENVALYQQSQAEREQQAAIFASASDGFALVDKQLTFTDANEAFAR
ncbi:MAG: GAF domain-containing protein, partial [Ktedonobacterales bacterium]